MKQTITDIKPSDGKKVRIAFIGDSITQGTGTTNQPVEGYPGQLQTMLGDGFVVGNFGKGSAYTLDANNRYNVKTDASLSYRNTQQYKDSVAFKADVVVIMMGVNDIRSMSCDEAAVELKKALKSLADEYASMGTVQKVYIATSIYIPSSATIYQYSDGPLQQLQREVAEENGYELIDIYSMTRDYLNVMMHYTADRIHPNKESYGEIAKAYYCALLGESYTATVPDKSETGVVYVKAGGVARGLGATPETAIDSLAKAVGLLRDGGGTIVICGKYSLTYETHLPIHEGTITVTSKYNGVDYQSTNNATFGLAKVLYMYGDYVYENINMVAEYANNYIACNYNNVKFGDGIVSTLAPKISTYPLIVAGYNVALGDAPIESISLHGECNITVNSGSWVYVRGGNRRSNPAYPFGTADKDAKLNITINGGTFTNTVSSNLTCGTGMNSFEGECTFTINGGSFAGGICAIGRAGTVNGAQGAPAKMTGKLTLIVNGGTIGGSIVAIQDGTIAVEGSYSCKVIAALKDKVSGFTDITVIE